MSQSLAGGTRGGVLLLCVVCLVTMVTVFPCNARAEINRRIGIGLYPGFFILDADYFELENGPFSGRREAG